LGTWTVFTWELGQLFFTLPIGTLQKKETQCIASLQMVTNTL